MAFFCGGSLPALQRLRVFRGYGAKLLRLAAHGGDLSYAHGVVGRDFLRIGERVGMCKVLIRFYEELNDFLPRKVRKTDIEHACDRKRSVKDLIESFGVPHTEVDLILVNGCSVDFRYVIADGDRISVYPVFESLDIQNVTRLRPQPLRQSKFVCDVHLRKLARRLRLLGLDTRFDAAASGAKLIDISNAEGRILLTCDRRLLMRNDLSRGICVHERRPDKQVTEVLDRLDLRGECRPFTRCTLCNGVVKEVRPDDEQFASLRDTVPEGVRAWCNQYYRCAGCGKVYWQGSHYEKLKKKIETLLHGSSH